MEIAHTAVVVLTKEFKITGSIDLMPGSRLTDYMTGVRSFFAMTDVAIEEIATGRVIFRGPFADVNRDNVEIVMPAESCEDCR